MEVENLHPLQRLERRQILHFCFNGEDKLFVKIFGYLGGRVECCAKSESSDEDDDSPSEDEDEENSSGVKAEGVDSDSD